MKHTRVQAASLSVAIARESGSAARRTAEVPFTERVISTVVVWSLRRLMLTKTASGSWSGRAKASVVTSRFFSVERESPC